MSTWILKLWPTERPSTQQGASQLDFEWTRDGEPISILPPRLGKDDTLEIYFSYSQVGHRANVVPAGQITASLEPLSSTEALQLDSAAAKPQTTGCSWRVKMPDLDETMTYSFRVLIASTPPSSEGRSPTRFSVDPEMVIEGGSGASPEASV